MARWLLAGVVCCTLVAGDVPSSDPAEALEPLAWTVGEWNGVGQPKRGSSAGAWQEQVDVAYDFAEDAVPTGLEWTIDGAGLLESVRIEPSEPLHALIVRRGGETETIALAESTSRSWRFASAEADVRLTLTKLSDIRMTLLVEQRRGSRHRRLAEIGYTRHGERLATRGGSGPVCVVTGGRGTMQVVHEGQTYFVCCSGCLQAFQAHPDKVIAAAKERAAGKRKTKSGE